MLATSLQLDVPIRSKAKINSSIGFYRRQLRLIYRPLMPAQRAEWLE